MSKTLLIILSLIPILAKAQLPYEEIESNSNQISVNINKLIRNTLSELSIKHIVEQLEVIEQHNFEILALVKAIPKRMVKKAVTDPIMACHGWESINDKILNAIYRAEGKAMAACLEYYDDCKISGSHTLGQIIVESQSSNCTTYEAQATAISARLENR